MTTTHLSAAPTVLGAAQATAPHAEQVRNLLGRGGFATLTTLSPDGFPYGSLAAYSVTADGTPIVLISDLAEHTRHARVDPRAGLFVAASAGQHGDPMDQPRVGLLGRLVPCCPTDDDVAHHLAVHPGAAEYLGFDDFSWWRLDIIAGRFVGGFGAMSWVRGHAIAAAPDPVDPDGGAAAHLNVDHTDAMVELVRRCAGAEAATAAEVASIDRHGMTVRAHVDDAWVNVRVPFEPPLTSPDDLRPAVVALVRATRPAS